MREIDRAAVVRFVTVAGPTLIVATPAIAILQDVLGVPNPSAIYLLAVIGGGEQPVSVARRTP